MSKTTKSSFSFQNLNFRYKFFFDQNLDFVLIRLYIEESGWILSLRLQLWSRCWLRLEFWFTSVYIKRKLAYLLVTCFGTAYGRLSFSLRFPFYSTMPPADVGCFCTLRNRSTDGDRVSPVTSQSPSHIMLTRFQCVRNMTTFWLHLCLYLLRPLLGILPHANSWWRLNFSAIRFPFCSWCGFCGEASL